MATLTGSMEPETSCSLGLEDLLSELRRRRWTLIRWGDEDAPQLMAAMFKHQVCSDVLILRSEGQATAYRVPTVDDTGIFNPERVTWQYHASPLWTLRAVFTLPAPGHPQAPIERENPAAPCGLPEILPTPVLIRPLGCYL